MSKLCTIGSTDLSKFIVVPSYVVNSKKIYEEYADGSKNFRRRTIRRRISGKFSLLFDNVADYTRIINLLNASENKEGAIQMTVWVENLQKTATSYFYLEYELASIKPLIGVKKVEPIEITIEER